MDDLIHTVRQRYGRSVNYSNMFSLIHKAEPANKEPVQPEKEKKGKGFFDFIRPQLSNVSQRIHAEISKLLERREKTMLQTINYEMPRLISRHTQQWKTESVRTDKTRIETFKRFEKRVDLYIADTKSSINAVRRELEKMKEQAKKREQVRLPKEETPITHRAARRMATEYAEREREELRMEISASETRTRRRIERKMRDEEEYLKRRRG